MRTKSYKELRWVLRGLSGLIIVFSLFMFIGENGKPMSADLILPFSIIGMGLIGLGLAWKWELIGGIIALVAFIIEAIMYPIILQSSLILFWPLTAVLFIVLWAISRKTTVRNK